MAISRNVRLDELPRMGRLRDLVNGCEESLGMRPSETMTTYQSNRAEAHNNLALESSPPSTNQLSNWPQEILTGRPQKCSCGSLHDEPKHAPFATLALG
jgi:hypothetical protein